MKLQSSTPCHARESGDPVFQSVRVSTADAAAYWMPAFAGMTAVENNYAIPAASFLNRSS